MNKEVINESQNKVKKQEQEYTRLCLAFDNEPEEKKALLRPIFVQMASLYVNIQKSNAEISINGCVDEHKGKKDVSAQLDAYCQMVGTYNDLIKQVRDIIDE